MGVRALMVSHLRMNSMHSLGLTNKGLVACTSPGKPDSNGSQFFITLTDLCDWFDKKHSIFGKVTSDSIPSLISMAEVDIDQNFQPLHPIELLSVEVLVNPFQDIGVRLVKNKLNVLSMGDESEEGNEAAISVQEKTKSIHYDVLEEPLSSKGWHDTIHGSPTVMDKELWYPLYPYGMFYNKDDNESMEYSETGCEQDIDEIWSSIGTDYSGGSDMKLDDAIFENFLPDQPMLEDNSCYDEEMETTSTGNISSEDITFSQYLSPHDINCLDRPPVEVLKRLDEAMKFCRPEEGFFKFCVPGTKKPVFDREKKHICLPRRAGVNVYSTQNPKTERMARQLATVLTIIRKNVQEEFPVDQKHIFYKDQELFGNNYGGTFAEILKNVLKLTETSRLSLFICLDSRGAVVGPIKLHLKDRVIDCSSSLEQSIPYDAHSIIRVSTTSNPRFLLIVEKRSTYMVLARMKLHEKYDCIFLTGKGYPDTASRAAAKKIREDLQIPVYGLADGNPDGLCIMSCYQYGSKNRAFDNFNLCIPELKWIGVHPSDFYSPPPGNEPMDHSQLSGFPKYSARDKSLLETLSKDLPSGEPYVICLMHSHGIKVDIEKVLDRENIEQYLYKRIDEMREPMM